ncbi:hypothetical protein [Tenacibaculum xiamenense]|uniref:hypothetical protein n=1 Tax=Tenacibaculum xiamenense TaxID=1261553 RepID=UPI0038954F5B
MKFYYFLLLIVSIAFINCKKEPIAPFVPKNELADFITEKPQIIDLDTLVYKEIKGKHGTEIHYDRNDFELSENDKVQLELIELYDFKEILYRNIQTLTTDNKLLETSGVLKIVFTSNGKEIKLKKGAKIIVYPPKGRLKDNDIFLSKEDSLGNISWDITNQNFTRAIVRFNGGITKEIIISNDSISNYNENTGNDLLGIYSNSSSNLNNYDFFVIKENSWNWINIDRFINNTKPVSFKLKDDSNNFSGFQVYIKYDSIRSFLSYPRLRDNLDFSNIPILGKTSAIIISELKNQKYYDIIELSENMQAEIDLNMKKTTKKQLKSLFDK